MKLYEPSCEISSPSPFPEGKSVVGRAQGEINQPPSLRENERAWRGQLWASWLQEKQPRGQFFERLLKRGEARSEQRPHRSLLSCES